MVGQLEGKRAILPLTELYLHFYTLLSEVYSDIISLQSLDHYIDVHIRVCLVPVVLDLWSSREGRSGL